MERIFLREKQIQTLAERPKQYRIGVTGLGQGVGTTFVASALAFYFRDLGRQVSYAECLNPATCHTLLYDQVAMDKRFGHRSFEDVYRKLTEDMPLPGGQNKEDGVIWRLPTPENCNDKLTLNERQKARFMALPREEVCIFDLETDYSWDDYLMDMDVVFVVIDPQPAKLIRSRERYRVLKKMELAGCKVIWIVNKMNFGVEKKQVKNYLKVENVLWLDIFEAGMIYENEYLCRFPWQNETVWTKMLEIFTKVSRIHSSLWWFSISNGVEL